MARAAATGLETPVGVGSLLPMSRDARQRRVAALLAASLGPDDEIVMSGAAWHAAMRRGAHRLFAGRHYRVVALTSQRLVIWSRRAHPHHHATPRLDARLDSLHLARGRGSVLLQVLARGDDGTTHVLEFRPSERALGRALTRAITG
jgi:hypothetical protein